MPVREKRVVEEEKSEDDFDFLQKQIQINRDQLDEELIRQPHNFFHVAEGYVKAVSRRDKLKHDLERTIAQLDLDVREAALAENEKATDKSVTAQIQREQDYHRAVTAHLAACHEAAKWEALRESYRQRGYVLKDLVALYMTGYFGEMTGAEERRGARERFDERRSR
jgi:hypothetical protein